KRYQISGTRVAQRYKERADLAKARRPRGRRRLLVFGVDAEGAGGVEGGVEGFGFFDQDVGELFFLVEGDGLELDHFQEGQEGDDHGVAGGAGFEEFDEADGGGFAREDAAAELGDHLGYGEFFVLEIDAGDFFFAFEDL